ncbi:MAG: ethanolamine ammonia-lyase subunit EutC [Rhodoferax sp.]|uniref:ethanolamine ammonia-lyase subunit EutC n=1 Tax=Rhodoferax sp. TaxID=50421 RepID=UPI001B588324|nr:ethanolamine ammonia-lyase subunit EutC [Rhodoferax sp.]MBP9904016.1 ethanolamine ammonia-lyase subunit EutC [Rhodoferax sp.]
MNEAQIADIVRAVMRELQQTPGALASTEVSPADAPVPGELPDLGSEEARTWIGVADAKSLEVLTELRRSTRARVCAGRIGPRPRTQSLLRFLADHSRSKETVLSEIPNEWVQRAGLLEVQTEIVEKGQYLTRPDLGRVLSAKGLEMVKTQCIQAPDVQLLISDGLSTEATTANFDDIVPPLIRGMESLQLKAGTPLFVRFGRVKVEDQIGELLKARVVILLIGERPGLGQSESLSCYMVYQPTRQTVEAERTCISNIHRGGTPPVEAAAVIAELAARMLKEQCSGIALGKKMAGGGS